jgi:transcriptional regulator with XRE-family HTH domain
MPRPKSNLKIQSTDNEFKKLRKQACLTQEQLAQEIRVAVSTIRRWENGQSEPTMTVEQMERFWGVATIRKLKGHIGI